jgi:hypothetical protein
LFSNTAALGKQSRTGSTMDRSVNAAAAEQS